MTKGTIARLRRIIAAPEYLRERSFIMLTHAHDLRFESYTRNDISVQEYNELAHKAQLYLYRSAWYEAKYLKKKFNQFNQ